LRGIATLSEKRLTQAPDLPTAIEQGVPHMLASAWFGLFGPAQLPSPISLKVSAALEQAIADKAIYNKLIDAGLEPQYLSPKSMATFVAQDIARWKDVVEKAGVKTE
jgi:tripartite-type tricarboxylate transporter receptor subunit TctC